MDGTDGITIALGATTTGLVVKELLAWLRSRHQKTEIAPTPTRRSRAAAPRRTWL